MLEVLMNIYPQADVFTLMYDEKKVGSVFPKNRIWCQTFAQKLFSLTHKPRFSLPLMSASIEQIELSGYDVVISSSSGFAHGVRVPENAKHVCYCHSPARYLWDATDEVQRELGVGQEQQKSLIGNIKSHIG